MPPFSYASLAPLDSSTVRLLSLMPSRDETAALQGQLHNYPLQESDKETHLYEALSYVWGGFDDPPHCIYINGNSLSITANLHAALLRLRNHTLERVIWVDALCINQQVDQEKGLQIQLMPRIYGQATQVIVYFGEAADDSDMALESIRVAADDENEKPRNSLASKRNQESILRLLKRPWFQRIWVLQEVGLARSILIICGSVEMNGYAFCSGVSKLESSLKDYSDLQSLIRPTIHLIRGSIFRPKYNSSSLGDLSLGELIDMYHNHKATVRHDKVYALLGMCSDHLSSTGLLPDYTIPWETLFRRLINFILHENMSIEAWDDREAAVIKSSGYVLGHVSSIRNGINRHPGQYVEVTFNNRPISFQYYKNYGAHWILQASAQSIRKNDIVCLLEGASNPTIIRAFEDHFGIIMIAVNLRQQTHQRSSFQLSMSSTPDYSHEFLLVWQWGLIPGEHSSSLQLPQMEINSVVPDYLKTNTIKAMRSFEVALILKDTGDLLMAEAKLKKDIGKCEELLGIDDIHILSLQEALASVYLSSNRWKMAENLLLEVIRNRQDLQGKCHQDTLNSKMELAKAYIDEEVLSRPSRAELLRGFRTELLEAIKSNSRIEERIMVQAAEYLDERVFKLLLGLQRDNVSVTENLVKAISRSMRDDGKMVILLEERAMDSEVTEEMVQFIAKNCGRNATKSLIQKRRADVKITCELLNAVAKGWEAVERMALLLDGRGADICVDSGLLATVARWHYPNIPAIMKLMLKKRGANIAITEETVLAAVGNIYHGRTIVKELFAQQGANIVITERMVTAAMENINHRETIIKELFAQQRADLAMREKILITVVGNVDHGNLILRKLFEEQEVNIVITEKIVIAAIRNMYHGPNMIYFLLEKRAADINITPEVMKALSRNQANMGESEWMLRQRSSLMMHLFEKRGAYMDVTEETVRIITNEMEFPEESLALLIEKQGEKLRVTEGMVRMVEEKLPEKVALLNRMKDNIQKYSSGSTSSTGYQAIY
ncbi:putative het domain protein [Botrytis fragariae]|uniref:Putative het domain protein n=1 Tax=Botrytis fragariae TaxID=1964551 RepID=A0A8H6EHG0_9HELO|nr:putative het domain protein [Botrytis fragariae]KAF5872025.1 putative het domain protein [Botrytis fragariae]